MTVKGNSQEGTCYERDKFSKIEVKIKAINKTTGIARWLTLQELELSVYFVFNTNAPSQSSGGGSTLYTSHRLMYILLA